MQHYKLVNSNNTVQVGMVSLDEGMVEQLERVLGQFELGYMWNSETNKIKHFQIVFAPSMPGKIIKEQTHPAEKWRSLLGKKVVVTLEHKPDTVVVKGVLIAFDEGGEARVMQEDGFICYCWPMLDVKEDV